MKIKYFFFRFQTPSILNTKTTADLLTNEQQNNNKESNLISVVLLIRKIQPK